MAKILNYGSLNLDYVYHVPHFVQAGETLTSTDRQINCGGKGLNQSISAAKAGAEVFHAGKIGVDGDLLTQTLGEAGVDTSFVKRSPDANGHAIIQVDTNGQNCILLYSGSNRSITRAEVDETLSHFGEGDYLMLQNEINELAYIIQSGAARGMKIVLNPSPMEKELLSLPMEKIWLLIFNEVEGEALSAQHNAAKILDVLRQRWKNCRLLLTLGSEGCIYDDGEKRISQASYRVKAVDTTAAGDTFTGYFVAAISEGMDPASAIELATRAAAIAVSRPGAAGSIPSRDVVEAYSFDAFGANER